LAIDELSDATTNAVVAPKAVVSEVDAAGKKTPSVKASDADDKPYADGTAACEVRLLAQQLSSPKWQGIGDNKLGTFLVERAPGTKSRDAATKSDKPQSQGNVFSGVCIKRVGQPVQVPSGIIIATDDGGPSLNRFCEDDYKWYALVPPEGTAAENTWVRGCTWNGTFHSTRPFTFTLMTRTDVAVADYVEAFRVYRNGDLMAAWNSASDAPNPHRVVLDGRLMVTGTFAATQPPHMAAMDLRILPRETGVTHELQIEVREDRARFITRVSTAAKAAADVALPPGTDARKSLECLVAQISSASATIQAMVDKPALVQMPKGCTPLIDAGGATPLSDAYRDIKNQTEEQLQSIRTKAEEAVVAKRQEAIKKISPEVLSVLQKVVDWAKTSAGLTAAQVAAVAAVEGCVKTFGSLPEEDKACVDKLRALAPDVVAKIQPLIDSAVLLDQDLSILLRTADEARLLAANLYDRTRDTLKDPNKQAQIFNAFTASLNTQGGVFEPHRDNPPLIASEQRLEMAYSDPWQGFVLAPWNAVPLRVSDEVEADLNAAVVIPILDLGGVRYQWSRSRLADFRGAVGVGFIETQEANSDSKRAAFLPNVSLGVGTFKLGLGYAFGKHIGDGADHLRVLVGADLFKLISGSNIEAF
jgi:hypothetical protein